MDAASAASKIQSREGLKLFAYKRPRYAALTLRSVAYIFLKINATNLDLEAKRLEKSLKMVYAMQRKRCIARNQDLFWPDLASFR
jgi:hypothetical protein